MISRSWLVVFLLVGSATAELPPETYWRLRAEAPVVVKVRVDSVDVGRSLPVFRPHKPISAGVEILVVRRSDGSLESGDLIRLNYRIPGSRDPAAPGPSPPPVLVEGQELWAWLEPTDKGLAPAAGGLSFGSLPSWAAPPGLWGELVVTELIDFALEDENEDWLGRRVSFDEALRWVDESTCEDWAPVEATPPAEVLDRLGLDDTPQTMIVLCEDRELALVLTFEDRMYIAINDDRWLKLERKVEPEP